MGLNNTDPIRWQEWRDGAPRGNEGDAALIRAAWVLAHRGLGESAGAVGYDRRESVEPDFIRVSFKFVNTLAA